MSGTVVSMARSMLMGAISVAASAAAAEMSLLIGVRKDIWFIDELETMHAFLLSIEATKNKSMVLQVWAKQVRDLSYGIEDCLDEFMVHVESQSRSRQLLKMKDRHRIANQIRDLKARVEEVSNRNTRYNLITIDASSSIDEVNSYMKDIRCHSASNIDEAELVGFAKPKEELIKMVDVDSRDGLRKVICVVGMGGLGKTTLARKAYESKEDIVNNFSCCAWVTVSQSFSKIEMLKDMIRQLLGGDSLKICLKELEGKAVQVDNLASNLREKLVEKRYFIVLDDLWTIDAWKWIKDIAFPCRNNKGSRIIVTTRDDGLAKECTSESLVYHLKYLQTNNDATNLLLIKSRKTHQDMDSDKEMKTMVDKIVKKCGGLPLAVLTIGGMLATKKVTEWESIYKQIPLELEVNPSLEAMRRIVTLSYNHLPSHLKSCFLYLSIFPEDSEIKRRHLVERWIAEGFVRARAGVSIEDVGNGYFNELVNRSMIQSSSVSLEGVVKSCRVHDIVRDVMVSISRDESFVYVAEENVTSAAEETFRHVAHHGSKFQNIGMDWGHVRSLTIFSERPLESSVCSPEARMLRILDLGNAQFRVTQEDINNIGLLCHLKYVNFSNLIRDSYIYKLPRSIGKLQGLRTLDIRGSYITELPTEICKLKSLHSLRCTRIGYYEYCQYFDLDNPMECLLVTSCLPILFTPLVDPRKHTEVVAELHMAWSSRWSKSDGVRVPKGIGKLKELQILEVVDISRTSCKAIKELGELVQLRKLSVATKGATKQKCKVLCDAIQKLTCLRSLEVDGSLEWLHVVSSPPPLLRSLKLDGCLGEIPGCFGNLMHLVKLYLRGSLIKEEGKIMEILGPLPNLMQLRLGMDSYIGEKLAFKMGAFPNLKELEISSVELSELVFEDGTSPKLEMIDICGFILASGIIGISQLPRLKEAHHNQRKVIIQAEKATGESSSPHPEPAAAGESSLSQAVAMAKTNVSQDDVLYTYNSC